MALSSVPGQSRAKRFLRQMAAAGKVPHALLFSGMAGLGKSSVAREFAKILNCLEPADQDCCDRCSCCRRIDSGSHPDMVWVAAEGAFIKIDQIRALQERLRYRPFERKWRVVVIEDAQNFKEEAANALLKLLEEPPRQNLFILLTLEPQMLLPTIVSRCCHVRFQPLEDHWIERHVTEKYKVTRDRAREVARLAEGSLERARWLVDRDHLDRWQEILHNVQRLDLLSMIDLFALTAQWAQKSEDLEQDLECIKLWVRDLLLHRLLNDCQPVFPLDENLVARIRRIPVEDLFRLYSHIEQAMQRLRQNANRQLTIEGVCLAIKDTIYGQGNRHSLPKRRQDLLF